MSHTIDNKVESTQINGTQGRHFIPLERRGSNPTAQTNQRGFYDNLKRGVKMFIVGLGLIGLAGCVAGCATTSEFAVHNEPNYRFLDSYKGYRLVERNNDIYLEKLDGSESRKITHTPNIKEDNATISKDEKNIIYSEYCGKDDSNIDSSAKELLRQIKDNHRYYIIEYSSDDSTRKDSSFDDMRAVNIEREKYRE